MQRPLFWTATAGALLSVGTVSAKTHRPRMARSRKSSSAACGRVSRTPSKPNAMLLPSSMPHHVAAEPGADFALHQCFGRDTNIDCEQPEARSVPFQQFRPQHRMVFLPRRPARRHGVLQGHRLEVSYQQNFDFLPAPFDGFGVLTNYTYMDTHGGTPLQGASKNNDTASMYYEKGWFGGRVSYTDNGRRILVGLRGSF
jgi:hypothetical protein